MDLTIAGTTFAAPDAVAHGASTPGTSTPDAWSLDAAVLTGRSGPNTDLFVNPATGETRLEAPRLLTSVPSGDFQLTALVDVEFGATFDAGVLLLWADEANWAKLCLEYSPQNQAMVVSVVTRGASDDANGFTVTGSAAWLRISARQGAYVFHASSDADWWHLIRHFALARPATHVGFEVQSPVGAGCQARFTEITYASSTLGDLRDGS